MITNRKILVLSILALFLSVVSYTAWINATIDGNSYTTIYNSGTDFNIVVNNTNLAPTIHADHPGTGDRLDNVTYWANSSDIELHVFAHAENVSETAGNLLSINDTVVSRRSGRPLGAAEAAYRGIDTIIPKGSYYRVDFENYHHYEWREYQIVSDTPLYGWTYVTLGSNFTTTSNTSVNTGLSFVPEANKNYEVQVYYMVQTTIAIDAPRPGLNWSSGLTDGTAFIQTPALQTVVQTNCNINTICIAPVGGLDFANSSYGGTITSIFQTGASPSGSIQITLASEISGTTVTMMKGSYLKYKTYN